MKRLIPILLLLVCIPNLGYADRWLDEGDAPKEIQWGELIIIMGCSGEYCNEFCDDTIEVSIPPPLEQDFGFTRTSASYWFSFIDEDRIMNDAGFSEQFRSENPIGIKASRPFTFYSDLDGPSPIATYDAGVIVKPIVQMTVVRDRGDYLIEEVWNKSSPLKVGDKIDTPIYWVDNHTIVRSKGQWTWFSEQTHTDQTRCVSTGDCSDFNLKVNREAKVETWVEIEVDGVVGYAPDDGFLNCWEG